MMTPAPTTAYTRVTMTTELTDTADDSGSPTEEEDPTSRGNPFC